MTDPVDHTQFKEGSYAWFHFALKGKHFTDGTRFYSKLEMWQQYHKFDTSLRMLIRGRFGEFRAVDKEGWKDGVLG